MNNLTTNQDILNVMLDIFYKENPTKEDAQMASCLWGNLRSLPLSIALTMGAMLEECHSRVA